MFSCKQQNNAVIWNKPNANMCVEMLFETDRDLFL